ncbi:MAG: FAD-dependent oxidoreductase [Acidobacteria bacterium]|nr:FAD-dependent oxidoreductase [Acidobacteriota bacterium]
MSPREAGESIAIIGSGVSGLVAAHLLHPRDNVTLFEADSRVGGHVNTVSVHEGARTLEIDTGFIVYNERNYVGFAELLRTLQIDTQPSEMSFSFSSPSTGLEYRGTNLNTLLAKRSNALRPSFARMVADIPRFNRDAKKLLSERDVTLTLRQFLEREQYSPSFVDDYLIPLGASIWSADPQAFADFPVAALVRFFDRHGLLSLGNRPQWRTVTDGARHYVEAITARLEDRVRTNCPVHRIERNDEGVVLHFNASVPSERFDRVVLATHADAALAMLEEPTRAERTVLGAFRFQLNRATLHTDARLLPRQLRARASWNYRRLDAAQRVPVLTYYANRLQNLSSALDYCITLNADDAIDNSRVIASFDYSHPIFDEAALQAQQRHSEIDGVLNTHFVGAYWGYGFHEDGVQSALRVVQRIQGSPALREWAPTR